MYEADIKGGRPSIAPEKLPRAMLLQVLYSIRSERQLRRVRTRRYRHVLP
jgi:transposase